MSPSFFGKQFELMSQGILPALGKQLKHITWVNLSTPIYVVVYVAILTLNPLSGRDLSLTRLRFYSDNKLRQK